MLNKKSVKYTLIAVFSIMFLISAVMLIITVTDREKAKSEFNELAELVTTPATENTDSGEQPVTSAPAESSTPSQTAPAITRNISLLHDMNKDCIGWIYIEDTKVNYPVMYTPNDPEKYLKRNFYGKYSGSGVPFLDSRCNSDSTNLIIYGHNMKNLTMFGGLRKYLDKNYLKAHPIIEFETLNSCVQYKIIEVRKTDIYDSWFTHNLDGNQDGKEYITLSTCYGTNKKARLLIIGVKYDPDTETAE